LVDIRSASNERRFVMERGEANLDDLYQDLAHRFRALSRLFGQLGSPESAQALLDSLISEDGVAFNRFVDRVDYPMPIGKCFWLKEIIESTIGGPNGTVEECWLRDDLTSQERGLYLAIAWRHNILVALEERPKLTLEDRRVVIPPGPFLDELKANGLVTCEWRITYSSIGVAAGKPQRVCI
jgi:hypothetical protein